VQLVQQVQLDLPERQVQTALMVVMVLLVQLDLKGLRQVLVLLVQALVLLVLQQVVQTPPKSLHLAYPQGLPVLLVLLVLLVQVVQTEMTERQVPQGLLERQGLLVLLVPQAQQVVMGGLVQLVQQEPPPDLEHLPHLRGQSVYQQVVPTQQKYSHSQFPQGLLVQQGQQDPRVHRVVMVVMARRGLLDPQGRLVPQVRQVVMVMMEPQVEQGLLVRRVLKVQQGLLVRRVQQARLVRQVALVQKV
jgi:hypothetical protein